MTTVVDRTPISSGDEPRPPPDGVSLARSDAVSPANEDAIERRTEPGRSVDDDGGGDSPVPAERSPGDPSLVAILSATVGLDAVVYALLRYVPEYLRSMGVGPVAVGAFGTAWLLATRAGTSQEAPSRRRLPLAAAAATIGLAIWAVTPILADESAWRAWVLVLGGAVCIAVWVRAAGDTPFDAWRVGRTGATGPLDLPGWPIAALGVIVAVLAVAREFAVGFRIVLALAVALAAAVTTLWAIEDAPSFRAGRGFRQSGVPHLGDVLLEFSLSLVSVFVVFAITDVLALELIAFGWRLGPAATFGVLLAVELTAAAVAARLGSRIVATVGADTVLVVAALVAAAFPLVLVSAPANPLFVCVLFAVFGARSVASGARRELPRSQSTSVDVEDESGSDGGGGGGGGGTIGASAVGGPAGDGRRTVALALAPLVGGVLYAVSPTLAFGTATATGAVGAWELGRTVRATRPS